MFGITLGIKSNIDNPNQFNSIVNQLDSTDKNEAKLASFKISQFFTSLDLDLDYIITWEEKWQSNITDEDLNNLLVKLGFNKRLIMRKPDIFLEKINGLLIKYLAERKIVVRQDQLSREALSKEIQDLSPDKFTNPKLDNNKIINALNNINNSWIFWYEIIWNYLNNWVENDILMKKHENWKYYIELDNSVSGWWNDLSSILLNVYTLENVIAIVETMTTGNLLSETMFENNNKWTNKSDNIKTMEKSVVTSAEKFLGVEYEKLNKTEILSNISVSTLTDLLKNNNISKLVQYLKKALWTDFIDTFTYSNVLGFRNYSKAVNILENAWYKIKGGFLGTVEAMWVIGTINSVNETQTLIVDMKANEKLKIIFDYNADGLLDSQNNFYTQEKEIFNAIQNDTDFENILKNLGYTSKSQFDAEFNENYYVAREKFKTLLSISLDGDYVLNPALMMSNPNAKSELNKQLQFIDCKLNKDISMNEKVISLSEEYPLLASQFQENIKNIAKGIYLESLSWFTWWTNILGASFNIEWITKKIVDTVSVWNMNGSFWIVFWKEFFRSYDDKTKANIWVINFIPYISASHVLCEEKVSGLKELFQTTHITDWYKVIVWWFLAVWSWALSVEYKKLDEETKLWRAQLKEEMWDMLSIVLDNISKGKSFEELTIADTQNNRDYYEQIKALFLVTGMNNIAKKEIITWAKNTYERILVQDNLWITWVWVNLSILYRVLHWFIPLVWINSEHSKIEWNKRRFVINEIKTVIKEEIILEKKIITEFRNLDYAEYENYKFNSIIQELQQFLISEKLLADNKMSSDGKWGKNTRIAYETYMNKLKQVNTKKTQEVKKWIQVNSWNNDTISF